MFKSLEREDVIGIYIYCLFQFNEIRISLKVFKQILSSRGWGNGGGGEDNSYPLSLFGWKD